MINKAQLAEKLGLLHINPDSETLHNRARIRIEELESLLTEILNSGSWYGSALELDYDKDGPELEQKIKNVLGVK